MHSLDSHTVDAGSRFVWSLRVRPGAERQQIASARNHRFALSGAASFRESDPSPCGVEYLLGCLGGDLLGLFADLATRRGIVLDGLEAKVLGQLRNPLIYLGVVGEEGDAGLQAIDVTLYVSTEADETEVEEAWRETQRRSPLAQTLRRAVDLNLNLRCVD